MTTRLSGALRILVIAAVVLAACSGSGVTADDVSNIEPEEVAGALGGDCDPDVDYGDAVSEVAHTEEWLEIVAIDPAVDLGDHGLDGGTNEDLGFSVRSVVSIDDVGADTDRTLSLHTTYLPGIAWALAHEARVFAALQSEGRVSPMVTVVLVEDTLGGWFFPGICPTGGLDRLGTGDPDRIEAVIGVIDSDEAESILRGTATSTATTEPD